MPNEKPCKDNQKGNGPPQCRPVPDPLSIFGSDLWAWYKQDNWELDANGKVNRWINLTGISERDAVKIQAIGPASAIEDGKPAIGPDIEQGLELGDWSSLTHAESFEVLKKRGPTDVNRILRHFGTHSGTPPYPLHTDPGNNYLNEEFGSTEPWYPGSSIDYFTPTGVSVFDRHTYNCNIGDGVGQHYLNGNRLIGAVAKTTGFRNPVRFGQNFSFGGGWTGWAWELIYVSRKATSAEKNLVIDYLLTEYPEIAFASF